MEPKMTCKQFNVYFFGSIVLVLALVSHQIEAQFFTKSSKSIPRMGRRSLDGQPSKLNIYRRLLIDSLVDEYGPNLIEALAASKSNQNDQNKARTVNDEVAFRNEQPIDFNEINQSWTPQARDERSSSSLVQSRDANGPSLAVRAFNTNRYIQHLASGQPLMSYNNLFGGSQIRKQENEPENG